MSPCAGGITVLSLREAKLLLWSGSQRLISISAPGSPVFEPEVAPGSEQPKVLRLFFSDCSPGADGIMRTRHAADPDFRPRPSYRIVPFDERMAHRIADWIEKTDSAAPLYVQCLGGISRSVAVAQALGEWAGEEPIYGPIRDPNPLVYFVLRRVLEQRTELSIEVAKAGKES